MDRVAELLDRFLEMVPGGVGAVGGQKAVLRGTIAGLNDGGSALFHLREQNAGLLLTKGQDGVLFEAWELLAPNQAATSATGSLLREFPDRAALVPIATAQGPDFLDQFAHVVLELTTTVAAAARPKSTKAGGERPEERDTMSPILATGLAMDVLAGLGTEVQPQRFTKRSREQVCWKNAFLPFHRSPLWLLLRVALRLVLDRSAAGTSQPSWYKPLMAYHHAHILDAAIQESQPATSSDLIKCMKAKLVRRITKLDPAEETGWIRYAGAVALEAQSVLAARWEDVQGAFRTIGRGDMSRLDFWDPTSESPPKLSNPPPTNAAILRIRELGDMLLGYLRRARGTYADILEALSVMYLVALEIWMAVDKLAGSSVPLLLDYDPMIPPEAFKSLLLETKDAMRRLREAEDYLATRKQNAAYPNMSAFRHFGHKHSFAVRLFNSDPSYETVHNIIEKRADQGLRNKKSELEVQKIRYDRLVQYVQSATCSTNCSGEHDPKKCQRCITEDRLKNLRISVFEWPLPEDENEAKATVVEIAVPNTVRLWRDITWNLVTKVFRKSQDKDLYIRNKALQKTWAAKNHSGLSNWSTRTKARNSICIASDVKFVEASHYEKIHIPEATPENVCACLEVGPRNGIDCDPIFRQAHGDTQHVAFIRRILEAMNVAIDRVQESWQNDVAVSILACLATRLLSLSPSHVVSAGLLEFLGRVRRVSIGWARLLLDKQNRGDSQGREEAASWLLVAALICAATFNIGAEHLRSVLKDPDNLALLAECSMLAHNHLPAKVDDLLALQLVHRWRKALFDARTIIVDEVVDAKNGGLDIAIKEIWADHSPPSAGWKQANNHSQAHILVCDNGRLAVSLNVLVGDLMVDGCYIQALPRDWRSTSTYNRLFGQLNVEVGPSSLPGMQFSTSHNVSGCVVHFSMLGNTLVARAAEQSEPGSGGEAQVWEYITGGYFRDYLPNAFVDGYAHWLNLTTKEIEFRHIDDKWSTSADNWRMSMQSGQYRLAKGSCLVMDPRKPTAKHIALHILGSIENELDISCIFDTNTRTLTVDLPRMSLSFCVQERQGFLRSRNYTGMRVDEDHEVGTLIGLQNKLVLKPDAGGGPRQMLIPRGDVLPEYVKRDNAVQVSIGRSSTQAFVCHDAYVVGDKLGCLIDSGSLQSKLYLCLLHASTSHCLPDPLTQRTGTEEALRILKGAAIVSYPSLDIESGKLLGSIGRLSPRRVYYPGYLKVMESTTWNDNFPSLSQHDDFRILANTTKGTTAFYCVLYGLKREASITEDHKSTVPSDLQERARIRNAIFRVAEFGADAHTRGAVANKEYRPLRDRETPAVGSYSKRILVQKLARCISSPDEELIASANGEHVFNGPNADLTFDLRNLKPADTRLPGHWSEWHRALASEPNIYRKIFFLATLLYAKEWDEELVQILMAIGSSGLLSNHTPPNEPVKDLDSRTRDLRTVLKEVIGNKQKPPPSSFRPARLTRESDKQYGTRLRNKWKQEAAMPSTRLLEDLITQASSSTGTLNIPPHSSISQSYDKYLELPAIMREAQAVVQDRRAAKLFYTYVVDMTKFLQGIPVIATQTQFMPPVCNAIASVPSLKPGYISVERLFRKNRAPENQTRPQPESFPQLCAHVDVTESGLNHDQLSALVDKLSASPGNLQDHQLSYINELRDSIREAKSGTPRYMVTADMDDPDILPVVHRHLEDARGYYHAIYEEIRLALTEGISIAFQLGARAGCYPRISARFLIQQLRHGLWQSVPKEWRSCLVNLALGLVYLQRAERLASCAANLPQRWGEFGREMADRGDHGNEDWDLLEYPEGLLLEIEQNITIRPVQNKIAAAMRSPPGNKNAVMQLNMGEGKSSVIVPIVAAALAAKKKDKIVRLVVAKPQASQMQHMMISRLGGLMNRRVFHMPFSRSTSLGASSRRHIRDLMKACKEGGGLFFMQPEHLLSFKLMGIDRTWASNGQERKVGREANSVIKLWRDFEDCSRDMVDESDENFNVRFELIYTIGNPQPVEMSPNRWLLVQDLLAIAEMVTRELMEATESAPDVAEGLLLKDYGAGSVPLIRILSGSAAQRLFKAVAERVCRVGLKGFPIHHQTAEMRAAVLSYILLDDVRASDVAIVEDSGNLDFFANAGIKNTLFLLRGLFAKGILLFALGEKRYRVDYGLAPDRNPPTLLAVPYRAKDMPSPRSEFSHPDVVVILTCLSYHYDGLSNNSLATCLELLEKSENPDDEYSRWVKASPNLPRTFESFSSINMKDVSQCVDIVFPNLRYARPLIDFYLAKVVFPKEMKEFKYKLSASGWDLARPKRYPLTGFSGTNDSNGVLPLSVTALDLQPQTNPNVLSTLLRDENTVLELGGDLIGAAQLSPLTEDMLLNAVTDSDPQIRVILDVGAQIVECSNFQMAKRLLWSVSDSDTDAVIFFNWRGEMSDTLVQACMCMRKLGQGQSVCFIVSPEMQKRICTVRHMKQGQPLSVSDVLGSAISGAWDETVRSVPLWATQGVRHLRQEAIWRSVELAEWDFDLDDAEDYVEPEAMSLKRRYRPDATASTDSLIVDDVSDSDEEQLSLIKAKLASLALSTRSAAAASALSQEQEQEQEQETQMENEAEEEREGHNAPPPKAAIPALATDLIKFVKTGEFVHGSAYRRPFSALRNTGANALFPGGLRKFPHVPGFWATGDFIKTVKAKGSKDFVAYSYLRDVQWVLFRHEDPAIVIISPFEAQRVKPMILNKLAEMQRDAAMQSPSSSGEDTPILPPVTLHALLARASPVFRSAVDMRACTFPLSAADDVPDIPAHLLTQLNLFAGHRYLRNYDQCVALCTCSGSRTTAARQQHPLPLQTALLAGPTACSQPAQFRSWPSCTGSAATLPYLASNARTWAAFWPARC
ncbi:hypothetical protein B0T26DRAFT_775322 [Lasiosphaeria miniovina]|uniref:ubiquitinyl hydrolase 1 n=1 Tax=Lasiosphaeria miniovina TaxID=1954250 RepID=A0AA40DUV8_9PEZI|nr:uncharacterized protein B0T26DRAFT_775322 [Lasiosphaeria miniovina]KAK0717274.1 hypothetical protein B0T26DRAFT_775322 [Lasiosphaeria miniovina]